MISKSRKFPTRTKFVAFKSRAKRLVTQNTIIYYLQSNSAARMAVVVPKKVNKHATVRNWLKRLTYDALYPMIKDQNLDVVVVYKPLSLKKSLATNQLIITELQSLKI